MPPTREEGEEETDSARSSDSDEHEEKSVEELRAELKEMTKQREKSEGEVSELTKQVGRLTNELGSMKVRIDELWKANCAQMNEWDTVLMAKEEEIGRLKAMVASDPRSDSPVSSEDGAVPPLAQSLTQPRVASSSRRTGRAPPIDPFTRPHH